jgi:hypothetical protein
MIETPVDRDTNSGWIITATQAWEKGSLASKHLEQGTCNMAC